MASFSKAKSALTSQEKERSLNTIKFATGWGGRWFLPPRTPTKLRLDQTCLDSLCAFGAGSVTLHPITDGAARRPYQADAVECVLTETNMDAAAAVARSAMAAGAPYPYHAGRRGS
jgi:hypothetical protein